jgi:hypothetical protein
MITSTLHDRNTYLIYNKGNDPLSDKLIDKLTKLPMFTTYVVPNYNAYRPDKVSAIFFGTSELYWVVLDYNKLLSPMDLVGGTTIKIPVLRDLNALLTDSTTTVSTKTLFLP